MFFFKAGNNEKYKVIAIKDNKIYAKELKATFFIIDVALLMPKSIVKSIKLKQSK